MKNWHLRTVAVLACATLEIVPATAPAASSNPNPQAGQLCPFGPGKARWAVKTSLAQDQSPSKLATLGIDGLISAPDLQVDSAALSAPVRIPQPVAIGAEEYHEGDLVTVSGFVLSSTCEHDDGDFHIDLGDKAGGATCAVVEVPNPTYIGDETLRAAVTKAQAMARTLVAGSRITVSGQFFYDATHTTKNDPGGGRGVRHCAKSLWEVHPVFNIVTG